MKTLKKGLPVLICGDNELAISIAVCLLMAKQAVIIYTLKPPDVLNHIKNYLFDLSKFKPAFDISQLKFIHHLHDDEYVLAIAITPEHLSLKKAVIRLIESNLPADTLLLINTESLMLGDIQRGAKHPERVIGANWVLPAHTTYFLEIITNEVNILQQVNSFSDHAKQHWGKDPYTLYNGYSVRARLMCALIREAFYLVENEYVSVEDIDRACRNDAGYYLPFAGNFRYMDLMGTYIYGLVMKDMNPDLSTDARAPEFFNNLVNDHHLGMQTGKGFYDYPNGEALMWQSLATKFSYQIQAIIHKYPFNYLQTELTATEKINHEHDINY
jgi:3-hydroxybutyryl-CoA dehydrogenase